MAWYAKIENNIVTQVTYISENNDSSWLYREYGGTWLRCEESGSLRNLFPAVGFSYKNEEDKFYPPKPYDSWIYEIESKSWKSPVDKIKRNSKWDEDLLSWIET